MPFLFTLALCLFLISPHLKKGETMQRQTLELVRTCHPNRIRVLESSVTFQAASSTSDDAMIEKALKLTPILAAMPGFINRHFAKGENGEWIDAVIWDSKENAQSAAKAVMNIPEAGQFFSLMNQETINLRHATIQTSER